MLQPTGKCANVCASAHPNPSPTPTTISPLRLEKGKSPAFQSAVHCPCSNCRRTAHMSLASTSVLAGPRAQIFLISPIQSTIEEAAAETPFGMEPLAEL